MEFFPEYAPDAPGNNQIWLNNPRKENYATQLSHEQHKLLDSFLPLSRKFHGDEDNLGDGYGSGNGAKWLNRREHFDRFYSLGSHEDWRKWFADLDAGVCTHIKPFWTDKGRTDLWSRTCHH